MVERSFPAVWVLATTCWIIGGGLLVASIFVGDWLANIGTIGLAAAVTVTVRGFFYRHWQTEVTAFRLGERAERERSDESSSMRLLR